jgi:hypothetical protein
MIFLSKDGQDIYMNMLAAGQGQRATATQDFVFEHSTEPIVLRGILKYKIMQRCWQEGRTFYYVDAGYFGNEVSGANPIGWKLWHRIVKNDLQHKDIVIRPADRFRRFNKKFAPWKKSGRKILVAAPDEKPCKFYGIDKDAWVQQTVSTIKQHTDRPVEVRERAAKRIDRISTDTLQSALNNDVFALVTYNSVAAVESIFHGIPAFTLAPVNAAHPVALQDLAKINEPYYADRDKLHAWACHLAYGQVHVDEMKTASAFEIINEDSQ